MTTLQTLLGRPPTPLETQLHARLKQYLNREPTAAEAVNMKTDANLLAWVQQGI